VNDRQRILLVVALGLALAVVVHTWDQMISSNDGGGWFAYAPNTAAVFADRSSDIFRSGVMWFVGVLVWAGCSLWILRGRESSTSSD
jgi:hypothetical protein